MDSRGGRQTLLRLNPRLLAADLSLQVLKIHRLEPVELRILQEEMLYAGAEVRTEERDAVITGTAYQIEVGCGRLVGREREGAELAAALRETLANFRRTETTWFIGTEAIRLGDRTLIWGILNVTPDSFYDGGKDPSPEAAIERGVRLAEQGADIVDVGGESTRPGATPVSAEEEIRRTEPVVRGLAERGVRVSIDTSKAQVARAAIRAGARIVNDVSALADPDMARLVAEKGVGLVLMHMKGRPATMQENPEYDDLMGEITGFLRERAMKAIETGVRPDSIFVDPGIGFGKTLEHNLEILRRLSEFHSLGFPLLVGPSRKRFIGAILDGRPVEDRLFGTLGAVAACVAGGAHAVRVHDVPETRDLLRVFDRIRRP